MKIISTIVDSNYIMYGLELEGRSSEFKEEGKDIIRKVITLNQLIDKRFKNSQIACLKKGIKELNNFKLKELPMKLFDGKNYINIINNLTLKKRLLVEGKLEGFLVDINGIEKRFSVEEIINLASWYNLINFYIKFKNNKVFISGKKGNSLIGLPEEELVAEKKTNKKHKVKTIHDKKIVSNIISFNDFDIITLYKIIQDLNGMILKLPTENYEKSKIAKKKYHEDFIDLGIGEIGSPYIVYGEKKLNINSRFKKIGNVLVNFNKYNHTIQTYTITSKHIFLNGKNYMKKFGIIIEKEKAQILKERFSKSLALNQITDTSILTPIKSFLGSKTLEIFTVDTGRLDLINHNKIKNFILKNNLILDNIKRLNDIKVQKRYYNFITKEVSSILESKSIFVEPEKFGIYKGMSDELLLALSDAGINVYTGRYEKKEDVNEDDIPDDKENYEDNDYEVIYSIKGFQSIPSAKDIYMKNNKAEKYISVEFSKTIDDFNKMPDDKLKLQKIEKALKALDREQSEIIKKLWMHKISCFSAGNYKGFKIPNKEEWVSIMNNKINDSTKEFMCKEVGCESLLLKLKGLDIL